MVGHPFSGRDLLSHIHLRQGEMEYVPCFVVFETEMNVAGQVQYDVVDDVFDVDPVQTNIADCTGNLIVTTMIV